ncbi:Putative two-component system sensor kinase [Mycobacteroides abscessus]|nr:Putative two-component system sensor kinase [Mycobacteroides abscessus]
MPDYLSGWRTQLFGSTPPSARLGVVAAVVLLVAESMLTIFLRTIAPTEHLAAIYLIGILVISVIWRLRLALAMSIASAIVFDCIRNWPKANPLSTESHNLVTHLSFLAVT